MFRSRSISQDVSGLMQNSTTNNRFSIATIEGSETGFMGPAIFKNSSQISSPTASSNYNTEDISKGIMLIGSGNNRRLTNMSLNSSLLFTNYSKSPISSTTSSSTASSLKSETNNNYPIKKRPSKNK